MLLVHTTFCHGTETAISSKKTSQYYPYSPRSCSSSSANYQDSRPIPSLFSLYLEQSHNFFKKTLTQNILDWLLDIALAENVIPAAKLLISWGAHYKNKNDQWLHTASKPPILFVKKEYEKIAQFFKKNLARSLQNSSLLEASQEGSLPAVQILLSWNPQINAINACKNTTLTSPYTTNMKRSPYFL